MRRRKAPARNLHFRIKYMRIYIEEQLLNDNKYAARIQRVTAYYKGAGIIPIRHYKDVFNRPRQNRALQKKDKAIILAKKPGQLVYPGAKVCQDFGNEHFYYTSVVMNCPFDCEYCYLQGMYPSGYMVIFLNIEDVFAEVEELLKKHPVYLCISYDTDLLAIEHLTGYVSMWEEFLKTHEGLTIEVRTKAYHGDGSCDSVTGNTTDYGNGITGTVPMMRMIHAFTLSPDEVIREAEHGTPPLSVRLRGAREAMEKGYPVRFCFDPLLFIPDFENVYGRMIDEVKKEIDLSKVKDVSIGTFRMPKEYLKPIKKQRPESKIVQYPFQTIYGICGYPKNIDDKMVQFIQQKLSPEVSSDKIFIADYGIETEIPNP